MIEAIGRGNTLKSKLLEQQMQNSVTKMFRGMNPLLREVSVDQALPLLSHKGRSWTRDFLQRQMNMLK